MFSDREIINRIQSGALYDPPPIGGRCAICSDCVDESGVEFFHDKIDSKFFEEFSKDDVLCKTCTLDRITP